MISSVLLVVNIYAQYDFSLLILLIALYICVVKSESFFLYNLQVLYIFKDLLMQDYKNILLISFWLFYRFIPNVYCNYSLFL